MKGGRLSGKNRWTVGPVPCRSPQPMGRFWAMAQRTGRAMADAKPSQKKGRKPPQGDKRQFLTSMDPEVIRRIKQAAIGLDKTASEVMEEAAKEWLQRHHSGKK
jgi:hypothetical protein